MMPSEIASHQKTDTVWLHFYEVLKVAKIIKTEIRSMSPRAEGGGKQGVII